MKNNKLFVILLIICIVCNVLTTNVFATTKTQNEAVEWVKAQVGKSLDYDGSYGAQCVDLIAFYYTYLGESVPGGYGCNYAWNALPAGWSRIQYTPGFVAQPGDVAVWTYGLNSFGHVGIVVNADSNSMTVIDQNGSKYGIAAYTTYKYSSMKFYGVNRPNFLKAQNPPIAPSNISLSSKNIAVGTSITASWNAVDNVTGYNVKLICESNNSNNQSVNVSGTNVSFNVNYQGTYKVTVSAYNNDGLSGTTTSENFVAHSPSTVNFVNYDGTLLTSQSVSYGSSATAPDAPSREGHTFQGWDKSFNNITNNLTVTATYKINTYTVNFVDSDGTQISTQKVIYGETAKEPSKPTAPTGYVFGGWNDTFDKITSNKTITAVYYWENEDLPISTEIISAKRKTNSTGYDISLKTVNYPTDITKAKVIAQLKTEEGKMVASEIKQIYLSSGETTTHNIFISYEGVATKAEVQIVGIADDDKTGVPFANYASADIDLGQAWSNWSTTKPKDSNLIVESRTEYRYRDKEFKTSYDSFLAGYTKYNTTSAWGEWSGWLNYSISSSSSREVRTQTIPATYKTVWVYDRWVSSANDWSSYTSYHPNYQKIELDYRLSPTGTVDGHTRYGRYDGGYGSYLANVWWNERAEQRVVSNAYTQYSYRDLVYTYYYYKWGNYSDWSTTAYTATNNRQVETRTTYRYKAKGIKTPIYNYKRYKYMNDNTGKYIYTYSSTYPDSMDYVGEWEYKQCDKELSSIATVDDNIMLYNGYGENSWYKADVNKQGKNTTFITYSTLENTEGKLYNITGNIGSSEKTDGKNATLLVYKGKNTDPTANQLECVVQGKLNANGEYNFTFKTKEEPSVETDDFLLMLGIEGATKPMIIGNIEAPKAEYKVVFFDEKGNELSVQNVKEGKSAIIPENVPEKEGHTFIGWDTGISNIHDNLNISPVYKKNLYTVIFVDWNNNDIAIKTFEYGDMLEVPEATEKQGSTFAGWDAVIDGNTIIKNNMIVMAQYETNEYTVTFKDWNGNIIKTETVLYGESAELPDVTPVLENMVFDRWSNLQSIFFVSEDVEVYPLFKYENDTSIPTINLKSGTYSGKQTLTLSCNTENSKIFYNILENDKYLLPEERDYVEYTQPILIENSCNIIFYAIADGYNMSEYAGENYIIETANNTTENTTETTTDDPAVPLIKVYEHDNTFNVYEGDSNSFVLYLKNVDYDKLSDFDIKVESSNSEVAAANLGSVYDVLDIFVVSTKGISSGTAKINISIEELGLSREVTLNVKEHFSEYPLGDANADKKITASDAVYILDKIKSGKTLPIEFKIKDYMKYVDVNGDGKLTNEDAQLIIEKVRKMDYKLSAEK